MNVFTLKFKNDEYINAIGSEITFYVRFNICNFVPIETI